MSRFWTDWSDGKRWVMGIAASLIVLAVGGGARMLFQYNPSDRTPAPEKPVPSSQADGPEFNGLPVEQVPAQISAALGLGDIDRAFGLLLGLPSGPAKDDECERIFSFSTKHLELEHASRVVDECWKMGQRREDALQEIALAKAKSPESTPRKPQ